MILLTPDANTDSASSASQDANGAASSSAEKGQQEQSSNAALAAVVTGVLKKHNLPTAAVETDSQSAVEEEEKADQGEETAKTEGAKATTEVKEAKSGEEEQALTEEEVVDDDKLPFHKHPRFQQLIEENKGLRPLADEAVALQRYCAENNITTPELQELLDVARLIKSNPVAAMDRIKPIFTQLQESLGEGNLPADLAAEVEAGTLSEARAKELARLRSTSKLTTAQSAQTQQQLLLQQSSAAVKAWGDAKAKTDPDYVRKLPLLINTFKALGGDRLLSPMEAVQLAEQAYAQVNQHLTPFRPTPTAKKALSSNGTSRTSTKKEPTTVDEVVASVLAKHR